MKGVFEYADYHRTIIGYHGTTAETADRLVNGEPFTESENDDDWFGRGIYFWEHGFMKTRIFRRVSAIPKAF